MVLRIVLLALLGTALAFSLIELGLSAYLLYEFKAGSTEVDCDGFGDCFSYVTTQELSSTSYLVFCSVWSFVVSAFLLISPFVIGSSKQANVDNPAEKWFSPLTFSLIGATMIFWLAGFANYAALWSNTAGVFSAAEAFSILPWLIYLALFVLSLLTGLGVLKTEHPGYTRFFTKAKADAVTNHNQGNINANPNNVDVNNLPKENYNVPIPQNPELA